MKSRQLLSVVFSLIMFTGVTAGSTAFAESDDLDDLLEGFCEMNSEQQNDLFSEYAHIVEYKEKLVSICDMEDEDDRENALDEFIDTIVFDVADGGRYDSDGVYTHGDKGDDRDYVKDGTHEDLDDKLERYCEMAEDEKLRLFAHHPKLEQFKDGLEEYCNTSDDGVKIPIEDYLEELSFADESGFTIEDYIEEYQSESKYTHSNKGHGNLKDHLAMYCEMADDEKAEKMKMHHDLPDDLKDRLANYCDLSEDQQDEFRDSMMDRMDELHDSMKDKMMDRPHMDYKKDMREHLDRYCEMTDEDKRAFVAENDKAEDHVEKMNRYCTLDESDRMNFLEEHKDEYMKHMKDKKHDKKSDHMDYDRLCDMTALERAEEITDVAKLDRISKWCEMSTEDRKDYKKENHGEFKDKVHDKVMDKVHDKMKLSDKSDRIKALIMDKHGISDERQDELKMKYIEKHGDLTDDRKSELKMKFKDHMKTVKHKISDERKSEIHDGLAEMKAFKAELREKSSEMTDEEKQQFREKFIETAKDMQLAWISPHTQMTAGVDAAEVQCREGFSLVMKTSNGMAMCLKADSALKMIDRGIVVPAI